MKRRKLKENRLLDIKRAQNYLFWMENSKKLSKRTNTTIRSFDELIYNNPLYLHPSKRSYLKSKKKKRKTVEYRRIDFFLQKGMGMNLSNHGGAGGNFCNGGTMVNGCWSAHSSLAQARSLGQPSRTSSFDQNGIDIQSYPSIRCHWVFANHRRITNEPCVTSDRCRGTRSNGDALENTPSSIF